MLCYQLTSRFHRKLSKHYNEALLFQTGKPADDQLDIDYVPTIFIRPTAKINQSRLRQVIDRHTRCKQRVKKKQDLEAAAGLLQLSGYKETGIYCQTDGIEVNSIETQTDYTLSDLVSLLQTNNSLSVQHQTLNSQVLELHTAIEFLTNKMSELQNELQIAMEQVQDLAAQKECLQLKLNSSSPFGINVIEGNDARTKYYTGLPNYATFQLLLKHTEKEMARNMIRLSPANELFLTLVKLRQNPGMEDLAYRFNISLTSVTSIFHSWIDALYTKLCGMIIWPITDHLELPPVFQNKVFQRVRCIIDCTEFFIQRPSSLKARAQTFSNYKRHNTVKCLVGISPSGSVTFISPCWGGRASDRSIVLDSNILTKLYPGDIVLADRGFTVKDDFAMYGVNLMVPAFTKGKKQLTAEEVEISRQMSRARIHIERVIGRIKEFKILSDTLPLNLAKKKGQSTTTTIDKFVTIAAAIVNMNRPIL